MKCAAKTGTGKPCTKQANESGFCTTHEKKEAVDKKKSQYNKILDAVTEAARTKGWSVHLETSDPSYQFATLNVWKYVGSTESSALVHITINNGLQYRIESTSFHNYGQQDLLDAISVRLEGIGWSNKKNKEEKSESPQHSVLIPKVLGNFDKVVRQLRRRYKERTPFEVNDEYDIQDILHALLRGYFDDVRPEEYTPSYAGSASRVDFLLKAENSVIEVKYATERLKDKKIGEQLIIDIKRYQSHPGCKFLYCLVYDPNGNISNPAGLEKDLSGKHNDLQVKVIVVPH